MGLLLLNLLKLLFDIEISSFCLVDQVSQLFDGMFAGTHCKLTGQFLSHWQTDCLVLTQAMVCVDLVLFLLGECAISAS